MKKLIVRITVVVSLTFSVIGGSVEAWAQAERRVALVIGNAAYNDHDALLSNPRNDAEDVSGVLQGLGFKVLTRTNLTKHDMDLALQDFARESVNADAALFFYAGHAMQYQGRNFLMPTDAKLEDEFSVRFQTISLEDVRAAFERVSGVRIMILDACRNNPLADRLQKTINGNSRGIGQSRGLARIDKTEGMVVAYATGAGDTAADGAGRNSPFTSALVKRMQEPGVEIENMFRRVASDVTRETGGKQHPEHTVSLLSEFYLNRSDQVLWEKTDKDSVASLRQFIDKYPSSPQSLLARNRLELLERFAKERDEARARDEEQRRREAEAEAEAKRKAAEAEAQKKREAAEAEVKRKLAEAAEAETKRKLAEAAEAEAKRKLAEAGEAEAKRKLAEASEAEAKRKLAEAAEAQAKRKLADAEAQKKRDEETRRKEADLQQRLAALEQVDVVRKRIEDTCRHEEAKLADLKNAGASAREQLVKFETEAECKLLRPAITATLAALPVDVPAVAKPVQPTTPEIPVVKVNQPEQIKQAQIELRRLGCFTGNPDGAVMLNDKTRNAVKDFLGKAHKPLVEVSITDEFIADLKQHSTDFCIPPKPVVKPTPMAERHKDKENKEAAGRPQVVPVQRVEQKPVQTPSTPARATTSLGVGMGF